MGCMYDMYAWIAVALVLPAYLACPGAHTSCDGSICEFRLLPAWCILCVTSWAASSIGIPYPSGKMHTRLLSRCLMPPLTCRPSTFTWIWNTGLYDPFPCLPFPPPPCLLLACRAPPSSLFSSFRFPLPPLRTPLSLSLLLFPLATCLT